MTLEQRLLTIAIGSFLDSQFIANQQSLVGARLVPVADAHSAYLKA
jgi:hypothetical protein